MKFYGIIGFYFDDVETSPGIWTEGIVEQKYRGDITESRMNWRDRQPPGDSLVVKNTLRIVADAYATKNWTAIKYVILGGVKFRVDTVTLKHPSLILEIGGKYDVQGA